MKKKYVLLACLIVGSASLANAQVLDDQYSPPEYVMFVLDYIQSLPVIGPIMIEVMKWLGFIASAMTVLSAAYVAMGKLLVKFMALAGAGESADKVEALAKKLAPYLKYFSMYNVKEPIKLPFKNG